MTNDDVKKAKKRLLQMHYEAGVGHIGGNLSCLDILLVLGEIMQKEDRLVISKGHAAGAYYITQWMQGKLTDSDLQTFHKDGTILAGHLENTGSLGHGLSLAAGYALTNKVFGRPGRVFCLTSDGEWDEGSTWEAFHFLWRHSLSVKIIVDGNGWQGFQACMGPHFSDAIHYGHCDGHDHEELIFELSGFGSQIVLARTIKGKGVSCFENKIESHYEPLTKEQYEQALMEVEADA